MAIDYAALKAELQSAHGALFAAGDDVSCASLLNAVATNIDIDRGVIPSYEIINATVPAEWTALSAAERTRYQTLTGAGQVDSQNANVRASFQAMFGVGTTTRTNLTALLTRKGSRAEQLFGQSVSPMDIAKARTV